jgi:hypothetical protein
MTHLEIYKKLEIIEEKLGIYILANQVGLKDELFGLQYTIVKAALNEIDEAMSTLEIQKKFCIPCFYINLKTMQQGLNRYLNIENPKSPDAEFLASYEYISDINKDIKNLVIKISYLAIQKDCEEVLNTAYEDLKHINRHEFDDDDM